MEHTIERVCNTVEREILAPHVERLMEAARVLNTAAGLFEKRMASEGLTFDPDRFAWIRTRTDPKPDTPPAPESV